MHISFCTFGVILDTFLFLACLSVLSVFLSVYLFILLFVVDIDRRAQPRLCCGVDAPEARWGDLEANTPPISQRQQSRIRLKIAENTQITNVSCVLIHAFNQTGKFVTQDGGPRTGVPSCYAGDHMVRYGRAYGRL